MNITEFHCMLYHEDTERSTTQLFASMVALGREKQGHTVLLRQVKGAGPITALAHVLTLENPERFAKSRDVGPYVGLVPKQENSGGSQPQLGISKAGDGTLRKLLLGIAQYILGPFVPDTDIRRYGLRLCERGGKNAKKRAVVAWRGSWRLPNGQGQHKPGTRHRI